MDEAREAGADLGFPGRMLALCSLPRTCQGKRSHFVLTNGPEFTSKAMHLWSQRTGVTLRFIQPGKPIQKALVESLNGKFWDECLNVHWFDDLTDARRKLQACSESTMRLDFTVSQ